MNDKKVYGVSPGFADLTVFILIHDKLSGLTRGIDDERVTVESLYHDGILCTKIITGQCIGLPLQTLISIRQILRKNINSIM